MPRVADEPNMSDATLLVSVEDLINRAMGPPDINTVNFKLLQTVLLILARQQRLLKQRVEIRISETKYQSKREMSESTESTSSLEKKQMGKIKEEKVGKDKQRAEREAQRGRERAQRREQKEQDKAERSKSREKEKQEKEREKAERSASKERDKAERAASKEMAKAERSASKEREKADRAASKEREKAERALSKEREKAERSASKEREKAEKMEQKEKERLAKITDKEREREEKEKAKAERARSREREKEDRAAQREKEKAERALSKEREREEREKEKAERSRSKEREKEEKLALREKEREERASSKEREKEEKAALKEKQKAEKEREREEWDKAKAERSRSREREKEEKAALKEKEKAERASSKEREKEEKEKEKAERARSREREKEEKAALKEKERLAKMTEKEKEMASREAEKKEKFKAKGEKVDEEDSIKKEGKRGKPGAPGGITITESQRVDGEKVLVVEKGPTTRPEPRLSSSIDVVTQSQFHILEVIVKELKDMAAPLPLKLPDNEQLRSDIQRGSASLIDTMQALQVNARVQAAEEAIRRMSGILAHLAMAGILPDDIAEKVEEAAKPVEVAAKGAKVVVIEAPSRVSVGRASVAAHSRVSTPAPTSVISMMPGVTPDEMNTALKALKDDLSLNLNQMAAKAMSSAETALHTAKNISEKFEGASKMDNRISTLYSMVSDYAEQLSGFDAGLTTQMQSFQEQIVQIKGDLKNGLTQLENVNTNAETAAVMELTERYNELLSELDSTVLAHQALNKFQSQLSSELQSLVECVEMLREQKCDRDEVLDGLRDKADTSRLGGLLQEAEFAGARADLEARLHHCHDKFQRQDAIWMGALRDLKGILDHKSESIDLLSAKDEAQKQLQELHDKIKILVAVLGEPVTALMTRKLSEGGVCGACQAAARMPAVHPGAGAPPHLPPLARAPPPPQPVCLRDWLPNQPSDKHMCQRWCGGSHTLVCGARRAPAPPPPAPPARRLGRGDDGRLYMLEEELQPCIQCNLLSTDKAEDAQVVPTTVGAGGDQEPDQR